MLVSLPPLGWSLDYPPELQLVTGTHIASTARARWVQPTEIRRLPGRHLQQRKFQSKPCRSSFTLCLTLRAKCGKKDIKGSNWCQTFNRQNFVWKAAMSRSSSWSAWGGKAAQVALWGFREKLSDGLVNQWKRLLKEDVGYYSLEIYSLCVPADVTLNPKWHW